MKTRRFPCRIVLVLLLLAFNPQPSTFAQGSLTPPGPPAPTMKTLAQIEPRTPVDAANTPGDGSDSFIISQPGSYFLTTNIVGAVAKYGITIATNNVTLDLNGFTLLGVPGSSGGIYFSGSYSNITVQNGTITGWGGDGVRSDSNGP